MPDYNMLSQEEIDALLKAADGQQPEEGGSPEREEKSEKNLSPAEDLEAAGPAANLTQKEKDALGEVGNISMGSAATTLSELLRQRVTITSPKVSTMRQEELFARFQVPYVLIQVDFKAGLKGFNILIIKARDAAVIADLMMGGDGTRAEEKISEIELSAASEAMNQMIGTASTSLSTVFGRTINISPPQTVVLEATDGVRDYRLPTDDPVAVVSFEMKVGELLDTEIMQIMSISTAKEEAALLLRQVAGTGMTASPEETGGREKEEQAFPEAAFSEGEAASFSGREAVSGQQEAAAALVIEQGDGAGAVPESRRSKPSFLSEPEQHRLELLLDIPLRVSVVLGRTKRPIKEVLGLTPGAIVELSSQVNEPVEILVNGTLIAKGEVVAVNENFGVRITSIVSPQERIRQLGENSF
ncbi:MAG: flagellar motor switch phosphatase FliY [Desulfotomaculales bacterium]